MTGKRAMMLEVLLVVMWDPYLHFSSRKKKKTKIGSVQQVDNLYWESSVMMGVNLIKGWEFYLFLIVGVFQHFCENRREICWVEASGKTRWKFQSPIFAASSCLISPQSCYTSRLQNFFFFLNHYASTHLLHFWVTRLLWSLIIRLQVSSCFQIRRSRQDPCKTDRSV